MIPFRIIKQIMKALSSFELADACYEEIEPQTNSGSFFSAGEEGKTIRSVLLKKQKTGESLILTWDGTKNQVWIAEPVLFDIERADGDLSYNNATSRWKLIGRKTPLSEISEISSWFWSVEDSAKEREDAKNRPLESDEYFYSNACLDRIFE